MQTNYPVAPSMVIRHSFGSSVLLTIYSFFFKNRIKGKHIERMTPKKLSQKYLKRAGEIKFKKTLSLLEISKDEKDKRILKKIVKSVN